MTVTDNVLDATVGAARKLMPEADEDAQAEFAARLIELLPTRLSIGVVQVRSAYHGEPEEWRTITNIHPDDVAGLNDAYGWNKYRVVEIGVCP